MKLNDANLRPIDASTDESVSSAEAWLPKSGNSGSQRRARGNGSDQESDSPSPVEPIDKGVLEWLPGGNGSSGATRRHRVTSRKGVNGSGGREPNLPPSGSRSTVGSQTRDFEELAELQRIEIQVLARRVEELESELSATRKDQA